MILLVVPEWHIENEAKCRRLFYNHDKNMYIYCFTFWSESSLHWNVALLYRFLEIVLAEQ